jgi:Family of unknown function (DUF5760)
MDVNGTQTREDGAVHFLRDIANTEEMKRTVVMYGTIQKELKDVQVQAKSLRTKKTELGQSIREYMEINGVDECRVKTASNENVSNIKKIRVIERERKEPISLRMIEEYFPSFFDSVDIAKFLALSKNEKTQAFFEFIEAKRNVKVLRTLMIV